MFKFKVVHIYIYYIYLLCKIVEIFTCLHNAHIYICIFLDKLRSFNVAFLFLQFIAGTTDGLSLKKVSAALQKNWFLLRTWLKRILVITLHGIIGQNCFPYYSHQRVIAPILLKKIFLLRSVSCGMLCAFLLVDVKGNWVRSRPKWRCNALMTLKIVWMADHSESERRRKWQKKVEMYDDWWGMTLLNQSEAGSQEMVKTWANLDTLYRCEERSRLCVCVRWVTLCLVSSP